MVRELLDEVLSVMRWVLADERKRVDQSLPDLLLERHCYKLVELHQRLHFRADDDALLLAVVHNVADQLHHRGELLVDL